RCEPEAAFLTQSCHAAALALFGQDLARATAAGRLVYDARLARSCVDALSSARCVPGGRAPADTSACLQALRGTVAPGAACSSLFECAQGLCQPGTTCPSLCPQALAQGAPCNEH